MLHRQFRRSVSIASSVASSSSSSSSFSSSFLRSKSFMCLARAGVLSFSRSLLDIGKCVEWNPETGSGFVQEEETHGRFQVDAKDLIMGEAVHPQRRSLARGQRVFFDVVPVAGKVRAARVRQVNGTPLPPGPRGKSSKRSPVDSPASISSSYPAAAGETLIKDGEKTEPKSDSSAPSASASSSSSSSSSSPTGPIRSQRRVRFLRSTAGRPQRNHSHVKRGPNQEQDPPLLFHQSLKPKQKDLSGIVDQYADGAGQIRPASGHKKIFFHCTALAAPDLLTVGFGDEVLFDTKSCGPDQVYAANVRLVARAEDPRTLVGDNKEGTVTLYVPEKHFGHVKVETLAPMFFAEKSVASQEDWKRIAVGSKLRFDVSLNTLKEPVAKNIQLL